jgi:hypothetical protein
MAYSVYNQKGVAMRLYILDVTEVPHKVLPSGDTTIIDYPHLYGFEVGDQIQFLTGIGTAVYLVTEVVPEWDGEREMRLVSIADMRKQFS